MPKRFRSGAKRIRPSLWVVRLSSVAIMSAGGTQRTNSIGRRDSASDPKDIRTRKVLPRRLLEALCDNPRCNPHAFMGLFQSWRVAHRRRSRNWDVVAVTVMSRLGNKRLIPFSLDAINFLLADVRGALGPYLNIFLVTQQHWSQSEVGLVTSGDLGGTRAFEARRGHAPTVEPMRLRHAKGILRDQPIGRLGRPEEIAVLWRTPNSS